LARLRRHSPWWIAGPVEQRFTGYEFDEARRKGMGFDAWSLLAGGTRFNRRKEALASADEGGTRFDL